MPPGFPPRIQGVVLRSTPLSSMPSRTGLSPSPACHSRQLPLGRLDERMAVLQHHISHTLTGGDSVCAVPLSLAATHGIAYCFLFLRVLRCFTSPRSPSNAECSRMEHEVAFGHPRVNGCMHLARAFRSLPRPSSAPRPSHPPRSVDCQGSNGLLQSSVASSA